MIYPTDLYMIKDYLFANKLRIRRLVNQGDKEAIAVEFAYRAWWQDKLNPKLQTELIHVVKQYMLRDLTLTEITDLQRKFGHKIPDAHRAN